MTKRALLILALAALGCAKPGDPVIPVTGKLLVQGKPAAGATVFFHPQGRTIGQKGDGPSPTAPIAVVGDDGAFAPTTYFAGDGLPEGEFAITVRWPTVVIDQGERQEGPDQLAGRYANPQAPAATVKVIKPGPVVIPDLDLK